MPARCWMAPETPAHRYSCGDTVTPVWPTCAACSTQPASTAARDAPTAAPSSSASCSTREKSSPTPRPPTTTVLASVSLGRDDAGAASVPVTVAAGPDTVTASVFTSGACPPLTSSVCTELGASVTNASSVVGSAVVVQPPASTDLVTVRSCATPTASVMIAAEWRTARRANHSVVSASLAPSTSVAPESARATSSRAVSVRDRSPASCSGTSSVATP